MAFQKIRIECIKIRVEFLRIRTGFLRIYVGFTPGGAWMPPKYRDHGPKRGFFKENRMSIGEKRLQNGENSIKMGGGVCVLAYFVL
jgi:hypothetical protein